MRHHQRPMHPRPKAAFTLIEMLVVIVVISTLISLTLPVLGTAREAARSTQCLSNLQQLQFAWIGRIDQTGGVIPYTYTVSNHPNWVDAMNEALPGAPSLVLTNTKSFNACPTIQRRYSKTIYFAAQWGYTVNRWWSNGANQTNELKKWVLIRQPSRYPWFMDPEMVPFGTTYRGARYAPSDPPSYTTWGVGAHHAGNTVANVSYADGHGEAVAMETIMANTPAVGVYNWFENR